MSGTDAMKSLHTSLIDAENGYVTAIRDAQDPQMKALFERMRALHAQAHGDLHAILLGMGERPNESESFMSAIHKTVISVRSAVQGLDRGSLPAFADGEERIVAAYDKAIEESGPSGAAVENLRRNRVALVEAIREMRAMAT